MTVDIKGCDCSHSLFMLTYFTNRLTNLIYCTDESL